MDKNRWKKISRIIDMALAQPAADRSTYIQIQCEDDASLQKEVFELMLTIDESEDESGILEKYIQKNEALLQSSIDESGPQTNHPEEGSTIGGWTLVKLLGRGGMGSVYKAKRLSGNAEQVGALKILHHYLNTRENVHRFHLEQQILAGLHHPNITLLIEGGISEKGLPFLVMEYVEGKSLLDYCDEHRLSIEERTDLFKVICKAVQHAHKKLIVHRDLKPDNILITEEGAVKILDFGIAKLLDPDLYQHSAVETRAGLRLMSLEYAAPEQVNGEPVTISTDIYALGILLFELLAGVHPLDMDDQPYRKIVQMIANDEFPSPSQRLARLSKPQLLSGISRARSAEPKALIKKLKGDPDAIVLKAVRKEPEQRYESVSHFLEDIERFRTMRPINARRGSYRYRGARFIARNKAVLMAASLFLVVVSSLGYYHMHQITEQRDIARIEAEKAELTSDFLIGLLEAGNPYETRGDTLTVLEIIDRGALQAGALTGQPEVQAQLLHTIGNVYFQLNRYDQAYPLVKQAFEIRKAFLPETDPTFNSTRFLLASIYHNQRDYGEAMSLFEEMVAAFKNSSAQVSTEYTAALSQLAEFHFAMRNYEKAEELYRDAVDINRQLYGNNHLSTAKLLAGVGSALRQQHRAAEAEEVYMNALQIYRGNDSDPLEADILIALGRISEGNGETEAAENYFREAITLYRYHFGPSYPNTGIILHNLANLLRDHGDQNEAGELYDEAVQLLSERYGENYSLVGRIYVDKASLYARQNKPEEAEDRFIQGLTILNDQLTADHLLITIAQIQFGQFLLNQHRFEEAERHLLRSFSVNQPRAETDPRYLYNAAKAAKNLIELYDSSERPNEAEIYRVHLAQWENQEE